jgi:hypothetical protein
MDDAAVVSPFSTRELVHAKQLVSIPYHVSRSDADKGKSRFARKNSPSGKGL